MKLARLTNLLAGAGLTFRRFPHIILCSAVLSFLLCLNSSPVYKGDLIVKLLMTFSLGVPAYFGLAMFDERYTMKRSTVYLMHGLLAGGLAIYFFTLPETLVAVSNHRYVLLMIMVHLAVSFAPFVVNDDLNAFWQYNRILLLRFLTAFLFSITLFAGLALAIYSVRSLFNVLPDSDLIQFVLFWCITLNTLLFLNGIPKRVDLLGKDSTYPFALKIFAGYVLLPLVVIFFVILYLYVFKVLVEDNLLDSTIAELIFALATMGLLAYLLLWPNKFSQEAVWIKWYKRTFFYLLLPLMVLLTYTTVKTLVSEMMQADLFIQMFFCIGLCIISVYFIGSKVRSIRLIPIVLFMTFLAAGFGPYNAFERSEKFVKYNLIEALKRNGRFSDGYFNSSISSINPKDNTLILNSIDYLTSMYGFSSLNEYFKPEWKIAFNVKVSDDLLLKALLDSLNLEMDYLVDDQMNFTAVWPGPVRISGYDYQVPLMLNIFEGSVSLELITANYPFSWRFEAVGQSLKIFTNEDTVNFRMADMYRVVLNSGAENGFVSDNSKMTFNQQSGDLKVQLLVTQMSFGTDSSGLCVESLIATCLIKVNSIQ